MADEFDTKIIAEVPIEPGIRTGGDEGKPITFSAPSSESAKRFTEAAASIWATIEEINANGGVDNQSVQPTTPPGVSACSTGSAPAPKHDHGSGGGCGCS
jgi:ATP-binding protein involved in chromosome partitioning